MLWFKHANNFRNTPGMKYVAEQLGDHGVAGVYRLYEVFTQRFAVNNDFSGTLVLSPPFTARWLAQEILTPYPPGDDDVDYNPHEVPPDQLTLFLSVCADAQLITLDHPVLATGLRQEDGTLKDAGVQKWTRITIPGFVGLADEYTARSKKKGLVTPE